MYSLPLALLTVTLSLLHESFSLSSTRLIYQSPVGDWYENIAIRPSGSILITTVTSPSLLLLNPFTPNPEPTLVHTFDSVLLTAGITETTPDTFYIVGSNNTLTNNSPPPGSNRLFRIHYPHPTASPEISLAATLPEAIFLNGLTTLNPTTILAADSSKGVIWAIDISTGVSKILIQDPLLLAPPEGQPIGVNGLKLTPNKKTLYFTNSGQSLLAKIFLNPDGTPVGPATTISTAPQGTTYDDFALSFLGDAFLATAQGNSIAKVTRKGKQTIVAGNLNSTEIAEPTAAAFGRTVFDLATLYVVTAGGLGAKINGNETVGAQVVAVDLLKKWVD